MRAFDKVIEKIQNTPINGHALRNIKCIKILKKTKKEIEELFKKAKKC